jgi:hypothetical protein
VEDSGVKTISEFCRKLTYLNLSGNHTISDAAVCSVAEKYASFVRFYHLHYSEDFTAVHYCKNSCSEDAVC